MNHVIQTSKGTMMVPAKDSLTIARAEAMRLNEVVVVRNGQEVLHYVDAKGKLTPRGILILEVDALLRRLNALSGRACKTAGCEDIAAAADAAFAQFEDVERSP